MVSRRIKYTMLHLSHKQYTDLLARPNWRRLQKCNIHVKSRPFMVSCAALRSHITKRIKIMAQPLVINQKYNLRKISSHYDRVHSQTLNTKSSKHITELSLPKKEAIIGTKNNIDPNRIKILNDLMSRIHKSRYQKYRIICNTLAQQAASRERRKRKNLIRCLSKPEDWQRHNQVLNRLAMPKQIPQLAPLIFKQRMKKSRPVDFSRIESLAQPITRKVLHTKNSFVVSSAALNYKITDRMKSIAVRKNPREIISPLIPGLVKPAALKAKASSLTTLLAKPAVRPPGKETDLKKNAFTVSPSALKAKCTSLLELLATPKNKKQKPPKIK